RLPPRRGARARRRPGLTARIAARGRVAATNARLDALRLPAAGARRGRRLLAAERADAIHGLALGRGDLDRVGTYRRDGDAADIERAVLDALERARARVREVASDVRHHVGDGDRVGDAHAHAARDVDDLEHVVQQRARGTALGRERAALGALEALERLGRLLVLARVSAVRPRRLQVRGAQLLVRLDPVLGLDERPPGA